MKKQQHCNVIGKGSTNWLKPQVKHWHFDTLGTLAQSGADHLHRLYLGADIRAGPVQRFRLRQGADGDSGYDS